MNIKKFFKGLLFKEKKEIVYPGEFVIVDYSIPAKEDAIKDNQNKIIYYYFIDSLGFRKYRKYPYSDAMVHSFLRIKNIPVVDKTKIEEAIFPVISQIDLSEVKHEK